MQVEKAQRRQLDRDSGRQPRCLAACSLQLAACSLQLAACSLQLAACSLQLAACSLQLAACSCYLGRSFSPLRDAPVVVTCKLWMKVIKALARWRWRA
ncbi:hypothetical protein DNK44_18120 [Pseudomonas dryadis]|uniref:Uncharacterized protein n=1 Tax=Phytopseudomonas dryadis TaxID=2487520 RepID=A0A4Q9QWK2_9GAMM|nr:hypothetical protein DNK44_18120 [Pseudomonas dryadis]